MRDRISSIPETAERTARNRELTRRQEWRLDYLVPIYVMWTTNVPEDLAQAAKQGVIDTLAASGQKREILVFGSAPPFNHRNQPFSSPDWYVEEAIRRQSLRRDAGLGPQVDISEVIRLFIEEPYQENPHWEVFIVNQDLNSRGPDNRYYNFVFGSTNPTFPASVQSVTRLLAEVGDNELRAEMTRRLLRHEVGHMFGLPARSHNIEENLGRHCTNICTMRQGISTSEWAQLTLGESNYGVQFCNDCMADLARLHTHFRPMPRSTR